MEAAISTASQQSFGKNPVEVRDTGHYKEEYVKTFVEKWDELIGQALGKRG